MYRLIETKEKITSFKEINGHYLELNEGKLLLDGACICKDVDSLNYTLADNKLIYLKKGETFVGEKVINGSILINTVWQDKALFSFDFNVQDFTLNYQFINLNNGEVLKDLGRLSNLKSAIITESNSIALIFGNELYYYNDSLKIKWKVEKSIDKLLGIYKDYPLVTLKNRSIQLIETLSGKAIREWKSLPDFHIGDEYKDVIPEPSQFSLDHDQDKLIGTFDTFYIEIDLNSGEASYKDLKVELQSHHISDFRPFRDHPFDESHMYLTTHTYLPEYPNVDLGSVVALNRKTFKIDWMHTFTDASIGTNTPKITKTHLYQRDTEKNLYIFERVDQPA